MLWKNIKKALKETDILLILICLALSVFGIIMVFSATYDGASLLSRDGKVMILAIFFFVIRVVPRLFFFCGKGFLMSNRSH